MSESYERQFRARARNLKLTEKYKLKPKLQQLDEKNVSGYFTLTFVVGIISTFRSKILGAGDDKTFTENS